MPLPRARLGPNGNSARDTSLMIAITVKDIIMKTIQITLLDELHQRAKELALQNRTTLKQFVVDAIEAHVVRMEAMTPKPRASESGGAR